MLGQIFSFSLKNTYTVKHALGADYGGFSGRAYKAAKVKTFLLGSIFSGIKTIASNQNTQIQRSSEPCLIKNKKMISSIFRSFILKVKF